MPHLQAPAPAGPGAANPDSVHNTFICNKLHQGIHIAQISMIGPTRAGLRIGRGRDRRLTAVTPPRHGFAPEGDPNSGTNVERGLHAWALGALGAFFPPRRAKMNAVDSAQAGRYERPGAVLYSSSEFVTCSAPIGRCTSPQKAGC